jgi:hypothetical protein
MGYPWQQQLQQQQQGPTAVPNMQYPFFWTATGPSGGTGFNLHANGGDQQYPGQVVSSESLSVNPHETLPAWKVCGSGVQLQANEMNTALLNVIVSPQSGICQSGVRLLGGKIYACSVRYMSLLSGSNAVLDIHVLRWHSHADAQGQPPDISVASFTEQHAENVAHFEFSVPITGEYTVRIKNSGQGRILLNNPVVAVVV